mgnify:CR=1 FL=1
MRRFWIAASLVLVSLAVIASVSPLGFAQAPEKRVAVFVFSSVPVPDGTLNAVRDLANRQLDAVPGIATVPSIELELAQRNLGVFITPGSPPAQIAAVLAAVRAENAVFFRITQFSGVGGVTLQFVFFGTGGTQVAIAFVFDLNSLSIKLIFLPVGCPPALCPPISPFLLFFLLLLLASQQAQITMAADLFDAQGILTFTTSVSQAVTMSDVGTALTNLTNALVGQLIPRILGG